MPEMKSRKGVLILSPSYYPDIGGVETHLTDLVKEVKKYYDVYVCTHKPIVTKVKTYKRFEKYENVEIRRFWWIGGNLFRKLEAYPVLLFLYMTPYHLIRTFFFLLFHHKKIDVIHVHGLNTAFIGLVLSRLFKKRVIMQTHSLYSFNPGSFFARVVRFVLSRMNAVVTLCTASRNEMIKIGIPPGIIFDYRYWIDLGNFSVMNKGKAKEKLGWMKKFTVFFVARLIRIKGGDIVCELANRFPEIQFVAAGDGPDKSNIIETSQKLSNFHYVGLVSNDQLCLYYNAADLTIVPSQYPEGFGRVIIESLASGTPVVASNIGGIPDALDESVGVLSGLTADDFEASIKKIIGNKEFYQKLLKKARPFAEKNCSSRNALAIMKCYEPQI